MTDEFSNMATMTDARRIMIESEIENDRKLSAIYQKRASVRDFEDENRINNYGGFDKENTLSLANHFTNEDLVEHTFNLSAFSGYQITSLENAFKDCTELYEIDLSPLNLDFCTSFKRCFSGCTSLRTIKFGHQCTINVKDMSEMFYNCKVLLNIDTGGYAKNQLDWNTSQVLDISGMFCNCESLTNLQVDTFDVSNVLRMHKTFMNCKRLTSLRVGNWTPLQCLDGGFLFAGCQELRYLDMENWKFPNGVILRYMFYQCETLQYVNLSKWDFLCQDMSSMFENCRCMETIDMEKLPLSAVFDVSNLYYDCESLISVKPPKGSANIGTTMVRLCANCSSLPEIEIISKFSADARELYRNCKSMKKISILDHQMDNVKYMDDMFSNCSNLTVLDLSKQNCSPLTASCAFSGCTNLEVLDLSGFDFSNTDLTKAFDDLPSLTIIIIKEIPNNIYIKSSHLYINGKQFRRYFSFTRNNGILRVCLTEDFQGSDE